MSAARNDVQQFDLGQPYFLALKHTRGILCRNHSFMYNLTSGKIFFVPKEAHDEIQSLHLDVSEHIRKPVAMATASAPNLNTPQSERTFRQLVAAIEVAAAAEKYALTALGRKIEFDHADIRALAISGFIEQSRAA